MNEDKAKSKRIIKKHIFVYSMLAFALIHFCIFYIYVNLNSFTLGFVDKFTGEWNNFAYFKLFMEDLAAGQESELLSNLTNTLRYFFVNIICQLPIAMFLAYFLYKKIMFHKFFMVVFMLPMIISVVVLAAIYDSLLSDEGIVGIIYKLITGSEEALLLSKNGTATVSIMIFSLWTGFGLNLIMFNGSFSRIPESVVESAKLEGVGFWRELFAISLPMIWPTFSVLMLISVMGVFSSSGPIILFTGGKHGTSTIDFWMYANVVVREEYNMASALGLILTVASLPIFFFVMWLKKKLNPDVSY